MTWLGLLGLAARWGLTIFLPGEATERREDQRCGSAGARPSVQ